jgi:hypothetical protein
MTGTQKVACFGVIQWRCAAWGSTKCCRVLKTEVVVLLSDVVDCPVADRVLAEHKMSSEADTPTLCTHTSSQTHARALSQVHWSDVKHCNTN